MFFVAIRILSMHKHRFGAFDVTVAGLSTFIEAQQVHCFAVYSFLYIPGCECQENAVSGSNPPEIEHIKHSASLLEIHCHTG